MGELVNRNACATALIFLLCSLNAYTSADEGVVEMEEVVVTGTRFESILEDVPAFVSVIKVGEDEKELLLEKSPGVNINSYGYFGDLLSPSIRGSSSDQVLVLVDGMRLGNGSSSGLSFLSLGGVDRIEVFRGGGSTLFGSDAMGGVINIITKSPRKKPFEIDLGYGSFNTFRASFLSSDESDGSGLLFGAEHAESDGDFKYEYRGEEQTRENNGFVNDSIQLKLSNKRGVKYSVWTRFEIQSKEVPGSYFTPTPEGFQKDSRNHTQLSLGRDFNSSSLSFNSSFLYHTLLYYDEVFVKREQPSLSDNFSTHHYFKIDTRLQNHLVSVSPELRTEYIRSSMAGRHSRTVLGLFLQDEFGVINRQIILLPSSRFERYSDSGGNLSGKFGIRYKIIPELWLKMNTGSSFRVPTFLDLYWPEDAFAKGNPELKPERSVDVDAGFGFKFPFFSGEISLFHNFVKGLIQWAPGEGGKWAPNNVGRAELMGVEINMSGKIKDIFSTGIVYTSLRARELTEGQYHGKRLIYRPEHLLNLNFTAVLYNFKIFLDYVYNSSKYTDRENDKDNRLPAYYKVNAGLTSPTIVGFSIEFLANNLTDKRYEEVRGYPQPGRNFMININYKI